MNELVSVIPTESLADECALMLTALEIPHLIEPGETGYLISVETEYVERARVALTAHHAERMTASSPPVGFPEYGPTRVGAIAAILLSGFHALLQFSPAFGPRFYERGAADAEKILSGEWWRAITALTLHADFAHILGNAAGLIVLLTAVGRWIGPGWAAWLTLAAGALGNLATAFVHESAHISIGASTSVFGALGLLAGLQLVRKKPGRAFVVITASVALLGMLGGGQRADVLAHLFGLLVGAVLGLFAAPLVRRPPSRGVTQPIAAWASAFAIAGAWLLALR